MKKILVELEVDDDVTAEDIKKQLKDRNRVASFQSRKRMAWIMFWTVLAMIPANFIFEIKNEGLIETIVIGFMILIFGYWGTVSYESTRFGGKK